MRISFILAVFLLASAGAVRGAATDNELTHTETTVQAMSSKLNRGVFNILTGWGEIPRQMIVSGRDRGWWAVLPVGIPAGAIMTVVRTGVGVFETGAFFVPINDSYGPIIDPAFVWQKVRDTGNGM
jgi:putative exosortase-associated protein (TIGR04073 family)